MKKSRKVTIQDVLNEAELELLGITETVDGSPVSSARKRSEFLEDCGMWQDPGYLEIQERYRGKLREDKELEKYHLEISTFIQDYFKNKVDEYIKERDLET